jgi:hypothetical protein
VGLWLVISLVHCCIVSLWFNTILLVLHDRFRR